MMGLDLKSMRVSVMFLVLALMPRVSQALAVNQLGQLAAEHNITCMLVFGDSSVDPGNNNRLSTDMKSNFLPYGMDFFNGRPTGRFTDGRLATDFIAIPAFLDPNISKVDILHGVSFASAGSGYDELTDNLSSVLSVPKQLEYFKHYKIHLRQLVGEKKTEEIIRNAIFVLSMGTNDFLQNYYLEPIRSKQCTLEEYQNFLVSLIVENIKKMKRLGATRLVVVGVPPLGCMPLVKTLMDQSICVESYNKAASSFNTKVQEKLAAIRATLQVESAYLDCFNIIQYAVNHPKKYGFVETAKGCFGTGAIEYGNTCQGLTVCEDPSKYVFWDAVHPTQNLYRIIAEVGLRSVSENVLL